MSDEIRRDTDLEPVPGEVVETGDTDLAAELRAAQEEATAYLGDLQRVAAEFENYRKRAQRERDEIVARATQSLVRDLLPVLDSLDGAFTAAQGGDERLLAGIRSTQQQFLDVLAREGLAPIEAAGMPFDPERHEAVSGSGAGNLVVVAEMRRGYTLRDRVLRPSLVAVAAAPPGEGDPG